MRAIPAHPDLSDCHFCDGPAEMLAEGGEFEPSKYFAHQAACAKCGIRGCPAVRGPRGLWQAASAWNLMQAQLALGAAEAKPAPVPAPEPEAAAKPRPPLRARR